MQTTPKEERNAVVPATRKRPEAIASMARDVAELANTNDKTGALLMIAEALCDHRWQRILPAIETIHSAFGYGFPGLGVLQDQASEHLLQEASEHWGPENVAILRRALEASDPEPAPLPPPPDIGHKSPSIVQDEQPHEDEATDFTMVGGQAWLTIGGISIRFDRSHLDVETVPETRAHRVTACDVLGTARRMFDRSTVIDIEIFASGAEMDCPLHSIHIPAGFAMAHRERSDALQPDSISRAVSTVLNKEFSNSQQGLVAAIVRDAETATFNDALTICDELMAAAINMKDALLRPDAIPPRSTEPEEWDDVCDTCNRSGVSISRTDDGGRTMCAECSDASDKVDYDGDFSITLPTTVIVDPQLRKALKDAGLPDLLDDGRNLWTHVNNELPIDEHTVVVAISTEEDGCFHYSTASYCLSGKVFIVDGDTNVEVATNAGPKTKQPISPWAEAGAVVAWFRPPANHPTPSAQPSTTPTVDREGLKTIHVLTFFPSNGAETSSIGGHDWWPDDASGRQAARNAVMRLMGPIDALADGSSFTMVRLTLPDDVDTRDSEAVTRWVDEDTTELRELPSQEPE